MGNWKKLFYVLLCGVLFTLNAQEKEIPVTEEVKTADNEANKNNKEKTKEEKKNEKVANELKEKIEKVEAEFQAKKKELENYMIEALQTHGAARGLYLGVMRLLRCHPFGKSGYDPVPPRET